MEQYVRQSVGPSAWEAGKNVITVADVAWATTELAASVVEALSTTLVIKHDVPYGAANLEMRFFGTTSDGDDAVINIYGRRDNDDYYQLLATLTMIHGTAQKGAATELWVDTIAETVDATPQASGAIISPADNTIARYYFKPSGYTKLAIIATTLDGTNLGIEVAGYNG